MAGAGPSATFGFEASPVTRRAVEDLISPLCAGKDAGKDAGQIGPLLRSHCRLAGPEFATIAATGGTTSATADIAIAATTE